MMDLLQSTTAAGRGSGKPAASSAACVSGQTACAPREISHGAHKFIIHNHLEV
jgi:hypothetical protein